MALRLGLSLPQMKQYDLAHDVTAVARAAEQTGYDSLWVFERTLVPDDPADGMYGVPGLPWTDSYRHCADPLVTLTLAAAVTTRVRLGSSVLVAPLHQPYELARSLATLDAASGGRVIAGFGTGWSRDEYAAAGADFAARGAALDELLDVCAAVWGTDPVAYEGTRARVPAAAVGPKPHDGPLPVMLAAGNKKSVDRLARRADGYLPAFVPHSSIAATRARIRVLAEEYGRDPDALKVTQRCGLKLTAGPVDGKRDLHQGSVDQIVEDLAEGVAAGVDEALLDFQVGARDVREVIESAELLHKAVREAGI